MPLTPDEAKSLEMAIRARIRVRYPGVLEHPLSDKVIRQVVSQAVGIQEGSVALVRRYLNETDGRLRLGEAGIEPFRQAMIRAIQRECEGLDGLARQMGLSMADLIGEPTVPNLDLDRDRDTLPTIWDRLRC